MLAPLPAQESFSAAPRGDNAKPGQHPASEIDTNNTISVEATLNIILLSLRAQLLFLEIPSQMDRRLDTTRSVGTFNSNHTQSGWNRHMACVWQM